jgi:glycosyltransferase involved in cell wall biosynthesis
VDLPGTRIEERGRRVVVLFDRFGPYHVARLNATARCLCVAGIELSYTDRTYAWDRTDGMEAFPREVASNDLAREGAAQLTARLAALLAARRPDAVAIPGWSHRGSLAALLWCLGSGTPVVLMSESTRDDDVRRLWKEAIKRRLVSLCGSALAGGGRHRDYLVELGMAPARIRLGYDVVDNEHFARGSEQARARAADERRRLRLPERYFLASSRFVEKKNLSRLVESFAGYRQAAGTRAWDLVILGDGHLREQLVALISRYGMSRAIHMPGFRQYQDLPTYYGLAGAFLHASTTEQWGLVVNEAMAAGLPVIVSRACGCVDELVVEGRNGFTFDPLNSSELTRLLLHVASETCDRQALGTEGRDIISQWKPDRFAAGLSQAVDLAISAPRQVTFADKVFARTLISLVRRRGARDAPANNARR